MHNTKAKKKIRSQSIMEKRTEIGRRELIGAEIKKG